MDRQSAPPGPEIGWAFGGLGFVVTVLVGSFVGAGIGFVVLSLVLWVALGSLFAFLVERSAIEEHDRADELQNTRLATLQPVRDVVLRDARPAEPRERPASADGAPADDDVRPVPERRDPVATAHPVTGYRRAEPRAAEDRDPAAA